MRFFAIELSLTNVGDKFERKSYGWLDLLGDLGGVAELMMICLGIFVHPISQHSFLMQGIGKLYKAKTHRGKMFAKKPKHVQRSHLKYKGEIVKESKMVHQEISSHRHIKVRLTDSIKLFVASIIPCKGWNKIWQDYQSFKRLLVRGKDRMKEEMDVVKLIRNIRHMKILLKHSLMTKQMKYEISQTYKNIIDIDEDTPEEDPMPHSQDESEEEKKSVNGPIDPSKIQSNLRNTIKQRAIKSPSRKATEDGTPTGAKMSRDQALNVIQKSVSSYIERKRASNGSMSQKMFYTVSQMNLDRSQTMMKSFNSQVSDRTMPHNKLAGHTSQSLPPLDLNPTQGIQFQEEILNEDYLNEVPIISQQEKHIKKKKWKMRPARESSHR